VRVKRGIKDLVSFDSNYKGVIVMKHVQDASEKS